MVIISTSAVEVSIHALSPLLILSAPTSTGAVGAAGAAGAADAGAAAGAVGAAGAAAGAGAGEEAPGASSAFLSCANAALANASAAPSAIIVNRRFIGSFLSEGFGAGLAGADADDLLEVEDEDLPVADLAGLGALLDRLDGALEELVGERGLHLHLRKEVGHVLGSAIELGVALLPAEALHLGDGDALHADRRERLAHLVQLERLDDGRDHFHGF